MEQGKAGVNVWDTGAESPLWTAKDNAREAHAVAFAPDGSLLAPAAADGVVEIRDAQTGRVAKTLPGHNGGATALAFSPDGNVLFCGEVHGGPRSWDVRTGRPPPTLHLPPSPPHPSPTHPP